jgi:PAS domain-containing protein
MVGTGNPLHTANNLLQQILNSTETMIFWKDTQRRFVGVNQAFLDFYGFPGPVRAFRQDRRGHGLAFRSQPF